MEANSAVSRADGIDDATLDSLAEFETSSSFSARERAALAYAVAIATANAVPDAVFERVRSEFGQEEIIELTAVVTWEICAAKFNRALEIEGQGICRVPPHLARKRSEAE